MGSRASPQARLLFKDAFDSLEQTINASNPEDARVLQNTTLQDVHDAARKLEQELGARQCLRNMARVVPFLEALGHYSKTVDVFCNGTPYLPFIWAPIKLILQVASDFTSALEKLISAYSKIAEILPRFDRLSSAFRGNADFQRVLATVYADILRFHEEAYKVFRKPGWKIFFDISWARFDRRFKAILDSLANHSDLVDREANAIDIAEAREQRKRAIEEATRQEEERSIIQFQATLAWLEVKDYQQDDELDHQSSLHHANSCNWILKNKKAASWMQLGNKAPVLWLKGKPGAGKSVLSSMIIRFLQQDIHSTILYYFCTYDSSKPNNCSHILRSLTAQILRSNRDLAVFVYDNYIRPGYTSSILQLKKLIPTLLSSIPSVRIVIDGLDEFEQKDQKQILSDLIPFASAQNSNAVCKILFASRDIPTIAGHLSKQTIVCLNEEREPVTQGIRSYVSHRLGEIRLNFGAKIGDEVMDGVERDLIEKAEGMFLWVRLVLRTLERVHSVQQLNDVVRDLPKGLETMYDTILSNIRRQMVAQDCGEAIRVLEWVAVAKRRLKKFELLDGVSLHEGNSLLNENTRLWESVIDLCKPLIEDGPSGTIAFVHFTVREYLLRAARNSFIKPINAHHNVSIACIAYLRTSFNFIDPQFSAEQNSVNVVKGFHGLHLYANEYWLAHLIAYANMRENTEPLLMTPGSLMEQLLALYETHNRMEAKLSRDPKRKEGFLSEVDICQALPSLINSPLTLELIQATVGFRKSLKSEQRRSGEDAEAFELKKDPTLFSLVLFNYKQIVSQLLKAKAITGISPGQLASFKTQYECSTNICRFRGCPRTTEGYSTQKMLEEHEASHTGGIKCAEPLCSFSRIGFKNSAALKRHTNEFHTRLGKITKPAAVRRQFVCGDRVPNRWGCAQRFARENELKAHFSSHLGKRCIQQRSEATGINSNEDFGLYTRSRPSMMPLPLLPPKEILENRPVDSFDRVFSYVPDLSLGKLPLAGDGFSPENSQDNSRLEQVGANSHNQEHSNVFPDRLLPDSRILQDHIFSCSYDLQNAFHETYNHSPYDGLETLEPARPLMLEKPGEPHVATINARPRSMLSNWQATDDETGAAYTFSSDLASSRALPSLYPTMRQVSESEVPGFHVYTPSEYVDSLSDPLSASSMQSARIPAHQDSNRLPASQPSPYNWFPSSDGPASPKTPTTVEITARSTFTSDMSRQSSFNTQLMGEPSMMRLQPRHSSVSDILSENYLHSSLYNPINAPNNGRSRFVRSTGRTTTGPISEDAFSPVDHSFSVSSEYRLDLVEDMKRSASNESNESTIFRGGVGFSGKGSGTKRRHDDTGYNLVKDMKRSASNESNESPIFRGGVGFSGEGSGTKQWHDDTDYNMVPADEDFAYVKVSRNGSPGEGKKKRRR